ncbi:Outward-rectifier potassium channel TOK1 [Fusarium mundagurra]|uniref:Outward-rectifier potassium channel TOK1 n=1 Tax=Fusarium mundagurra TaxID=1567541 RepID=A0A8H5Y0Y0_9HYPO|nr:Outward-rectifier potassium channel TOK1 [Fusarium mundagurra]
MAPPDDEYFNQHLHSDTGTATTQTETLHNGDVSHEPGRWWFLSTAFPMIAGTLGPVASAFSILSLAEPWRQSLIAGGNTEDAVDVPDPSWLLIIEGIQLLVGIIANLFLLLNMARRIRFGLALPITIVGWYTSSICRIALCAIVARPFKDKGISDQDIIWSQSFYYGMFAAILYFADASLLTITFWGACTHRYHKDLLLTMSQRTLMLQSILLLIYLLLGAFIFSEIESWSYLDAVYWTVVTLFTVGFGDYHPTTDLGRALLIPFALAGIISLGLVISSVRSLILENGKRCVGARIDNRKRDKIIRKMLLTSNLNTLDPIYQGLQTPHASSAELQKREFERRRAEFQLMRRIQAKSSRRRRWVAMGISTFLWLLLWLLGAFIFQKAEQGYQGWTYFDAVYFCFVAWTTIGYGDFAPVSNPGRSFYVFWSLLALPTMTILISNASDTVVRIVRDVTILIGNVTILPNDGGFVRNVKSLVSKITFGKIFRDHSIGSDGTAASSKTIDQQLPTDQGPFTISNSRSIQPHALFTSYWENNIENHPRGAGLQFLLMSEIRVIIDHLKESKPHHYTFDQWAWYLKLIGEDEHNPRTHCRVDKQKDGHNISEKWSWIGNTSPLISSKGESEWILGKLMDKLQSTLMEEKRGHGGELESGGAAC